APKRSSATRRSAPAATTSPRTAAGRPIALAANEVLEEEERVRRPLGEPPHQIAVPVRSERGRDQHPEPAPDEVELQLRPHAVQHLELKPLPRDPLTLGERDRVLDQLLVVRGNGRETAFTERPLDE